MRNVILVLLLSLLTTFVFAQNSVEKDSTTLEYEANKLKGTVDAWFGRDHEKKQSLQVIYSDSLVKRITFQDATIKRLKASIDSVKNACSNSKAITNNAFEKGSVLYFKVNDDALSIASKEALDELVKKLNKDNSSIKIVGHADETGSDYYNDKLSYRRAMSVSKYLSAHYGISDKKIAVFFMGNDYTINSEKTSSENRKLSRRVEVFVIPSK